MMMRDMQPIERYTGQIKDGLILGNNLVILIHLCGPPPPHTAPKLRSTRQRSNSLTPTGRRIK